MESKQIQRSADLSLTGAPIVAPGHTYESVGNAINDIVLEKGIRPGWGFVFAIASFFCMVLTASVFWLLKKGTGVWGLNIPVGWAFDITNFVWWIGIGHAGTLISAILLLFKQEWRTSINRFAEAMTLFAVACAGMFPLLHLGRPWNFFWLFPYPNTMAMWPQFRSPLMWDVFAVSTYGSVSLMFWYVGLIPDLASLRDQARNKFAKYAYAIFSLGWRGSARHWNRYEVAYLLLAGLSTPLVLSVHTVVSFDFAVSQLPGWNATIFPPYFVAGAIFSGFAMVMTLAIPVRKYYNLTGFITMRHLENMCKVMVATGLIVAYGYFMEIFMGFYGGNPFETYMFNNRFAGPYWKEYAALWVCNIFIPQLFWSKKVRTNIPMMFVLSLVINVGMWLERFIIIVTSLHRDFLVSSWGMFEPTIWDWGLYTGTLGFFTFLFLLFLRFLPAIAAFEMKELVWKKEGPAAAKVA